LSGSGGDPSSIHLLKSLGFHCICSICVVVLF
jgi:hypothetical protein